MKLGGNVDMKSIRIKGLRAIDDSGDIELTRCNIFIGANGTGKSTILRTFPLFKQTCIKRTNAPILWYDQEGVDLGSFNESINQKSNDGKMAFTFGLHKQLDIDPLDLIERNYLLTKYKKTNRKKLYEYIFAKALSKDSVNFPVNVNSVGFSIENDKFSEVSVRIDDNEVIFKSGYGLIVNGTKYLLKSLNLLNSTYSILPSLLKNNTEGVNSVKKYLFDKLIKLLNFPIDSNSENSLYNLVDILQCIQYKTDSNLFKKNLVECEFFKNTSEKLNYLKIYNIYISLLAFTILNDLDNLTTNYFKNTIYIAPLRATAERFYRIQGISIDEVNSTGNNIPMLLNAISKKENDLLALWNKFTEDNFGIRYFTEDNGSNVSLKIQLKNGVFNLADTGFGYSQILPILMAIWQESISKTISHFFKNNNSIEARLLSEKFQIYKNYSEQRTIIIEQPELHLHPKMQSQFAKLIFKCIKEINNINFIIETHSKQIIETLGYLIDSEKEKSYSKQFNIYLVNDIKDNSSQKIIKTNFDDNGILLEWPIGFMDGY